MKKVVLNFIEFVLIVVLIIALFDNKNDISSNKNKKYRDFDVENYPVSEQRFISVMKDYAIYASNVNNPAEYYALLRKRTNLVREIVPNGKLKDWGGEVMSISTSKLENILGNEVDGVILQVKISSNPQIKFFFLINAYDAGVIEQVASLKIGDIVTISGRFHELDGYKKDNKKEMLTEPMYTMSLYDVKRGFEDFYVYFLDGELKRECDHHRNCREYFEYGGGLQAEGTLVNGKKEGKWKFYHEKGYLIAEGKFHGDKKDGVLYNYNEKGGIVSAGVYVNDRAVDVKKYYENSSLESKLDVDLKDKGIFQEYYENGGLKTEIEGIFKQDEMKLISNGVLKRYYENGNLKEESTYKYDSLNGVSKIYYENGKLKMGGNFKDGKQDGTWKYYYEDGNLLAEYIFKNGKRNGIMKDYYENGNVAKEDNYQNDELNGIGKLYRDDGTLRAEINYKNDKLDGLNKRFFGDGSFCERIWNRGKLQSGRCYDKNGNNINLNGLIKFYHKNGKLEAETNYINGKAEGISRVYYTNGNIEEESSWKNDELNGAIKYFDMHGKLISVVNYKDGEIVK